MNAFEFGQSLGEKMAAGPKGAMGMLSGLMQTPGQVGQKAMLAARRELKPLSPYAPTRSLSNPNPSGNYNKTFDSLRRSGVDHDTAAFHANNAGAAYVPRRDALQYVGQDAARAQLMRQGKALGAGAIGGASIAGAYGRGPLALPQQAPELEVKAPRPKLPALK